ncbi:MAG: TlpA disulfide reductase family protein [Acidobacteriaceae bacterium]
MGTVAVVVAAVLVLLVAGVRERMGQRAGLTEIGRRQPMAGLDMAEAGGGRWRMGDHRGEVVAINLWATWCGPCREETPTLERAVKEFGGRGFSVVGVSLDEGDRESKVRAFAERYGVSYPLAFPDAMSQMSAGLEGIPTTLLIDRRGRVAKTYVGEVPGGVLAEDVGRLLAE